MPVLLLSVEYLDLEHLVKSPLSFLPLYVSLHITLNRSQSLAYCNCTPAQCSPYIFNHDVWVNRNPFY